MGCEESSSGNHTLNSNGSGAFPWQKVHRFDVVFGIFLFYYFYPSFHWSLMRFSLLLSSLPVSALTRVIAGHS